MRCAAAFAEQGVVLTAYEGGAIRLSMPACEWRREELYQVGRALTAVA